MPCSLSKPVAALLIAAAASGCYLIPTAPNDYDRAAIGAARWLRSVAVDTEEGRTWPTEPERSSLGSADLYSGDAGVVLFFIEAWERTRNREFFEHALQGARALAAALPTEASEPFDAGLFTGIAGMGYVLHRGFEATGDRALHDGALHCVRLLHLSARAAGDGKEWNASNDVVSGSAGIGLFLLHAAAEMDHRASGDLAALAGRRLVEKAIPAGDGLKWRIDAEYERLMPNFSHGTAGVSFFLALLHEATGEERFLDAALSGGAYLLQTADERGLVFHHEPGGERLFYLGWCHGPAGTGRLFLKLWKATGDRRWLDAVHRAARGVMTSGIPDRETPGFWNNAGLCCGLSGVAAFFADLHRESPRPGYLDFARTLTDEIVRRATVDRSGYRWIHAEHRVKPSLLSAQTGLMQGAAGIGIWLLRLSAPGEGTPAFGEGEEYDPLLPFGILCSS